MRGTSDHIVRRIFAFLAASFLIFSAVLPFTAISTQAKDKSFTMEFHYQLPEGKETIWQASARKENDDLINFANFTDGKVGAVPFIRGAFTDAGEITVTADSDGYHFTIPGVSIEMDTGDTGISNHYVIHMDEMSFSGDGFIYVEPENSSDRRFWYGDFRLDHPVTFTETYEIYYYEEREWQNTYHYEYTLEKLRLVPQFEADRDGNPFVEEDGSIHATDTFYFKGSCHWWDEDDWVDEVFEDGSYLYNEDPPDYFSGDTGPIYIRGFAPASSGEAGKEDQTVTGKADKEAGEDDGEVIDNDIILGQKGSDEDGTPSLPAAVATGVGGTVAAVGAAVVTSRKKEDESGEGPDENAGEQTVFRMVVYKNFGDLIKKGAKGVHVLARITEFHPLSGRTVPRNDLTRMISCFSSDRHLIIEDRGITVTDYEWRNALVTAPEDSPFDEGQVSFSLAGPGGTFTRNVVFRLLGAPKLCFPEDSGDGKWILNERGEAKLIAGAGEKCSVRFHIENATEKPALSVEGSSEDYTVSFEEDPGFENTYFAVLQNTSLPPEDGNIFLTPKESRFTIHALFSDKSELTGDVFVTICPEGLSVKVKDAKIDEEGNVVVECIPKEVFYGDDKEATKVFVYPYFEFTLTTLSDKGAATVDLTRDMMRVSELLPSDDRTKNLLLKFEYEIDWLSDTESSFWFTQKDALYEGKTGYRAELPVACSHDGEDYEIRIPLRLKGEYLEALADRERELKNLLRAMRLYIEDDAERAEWFYFFKDRLTDTKVSAKTYRLMRWQIYEIWQANAASETEHWIAWGDTFDNWTTAADWTKWIAVRCFAIVAKKYAAINYGPLGESLADAFVQPAAEFVLDCVEELTDATLNGRDFDIEKTKYWVRLSEGGDNLAWSFTSDAVLDLYKAPTDGAAALSMKQRITRTCTYIGIYFGYTVLRNFLAKMRETGEADLPGAIWDSFKDLTTNVIKTTVGKLFGHWMEKCPNFCQQVAEFTGATLQKNFGEQAAGMLGEMVVSKDFAGKWVEELVGEGVGKVFEAVEEWAPQSWAAGKLNTVTFSTTSLQGVSGAYVAFELYHPAKGAPIYCEIDLLRGLSAAASGPLAPFTLLCQYLLGAITGAPAPVVFSAEKPDITNDDVYNFEKLHQKTEQDMAEWIFDKTGLSDATTYVNQKVSDVGNAVYDGIDSAVDKTGLGSGGDKTREVIGNAMQGGVELTREGMEPAVNALADAKIEAESRRI